MEWGGGALTWAGTNLQRPGLLDCALMILNEHCPPEPDMQLCRRMEDDDGESCRTCWTCYLFYVANGRRQNPYQKSAG